MTINRIATSLPNIAIVEHVDGYKVIEYYFDDYEVIGKFKTLSAARQYVADMK